MPSTFIRQGLLSGEGSLLDDGHLDCVVTVVQIAEAGVSIDAVTERGDSATVQAVIQEGGQPDRMDLDRLNCIPSRAPGLLTWKLYFSNDKYYVKTVPEEAQDDEDQSGVWNSSTKSVPKSLPVFVKTQMTALSAYGTTLELPVYQKKWIENILPEVHSVWQVRTTTDTWTSSIETAVNSRAGTIHLINGKPYEFNGASNVRRSYDATTDTTSYEVTYAWTIDPGTRSIGVGSDQTDTDQEIVLPPIIPEGDSSLSMPLFSFEGAKYTRLPFHGVMHGGKIDTTAEPSWVQFATATFDSQYYSDWLELPGDPIGTL